VSARAGGTCRGVRAPRAAGIRATGGDRGGARVGRAAFAAVMMVHAACAMAQEYAPAVYAQGGPLRFVDAGLPPAVRATTVEIATTRWDGLPELSAVALAIGGGRGVVRGAVAAARAGTGPLAWESAAAAAGVAGARAGAGVSAVARRDPADPRGSAGVAIGGGAWARAAHGIRAWASEPGMWEGGTAPPLATALELGAEARGAGACAWLAMAEGRGAIARRAGVSVGSRAGGVALEARDGPLRGSLGVWCAVGGVSVAGSVESHPVLPETVRVSLRWGGGPW
jgi:hypothetical protein